jgi:hypothetical protein
MAVGNRNAIWMPRPPVAGPFDINTASPQAEGLVAWIPDTLRNNPLALNPLNVTNSSNTVAADAQMGQVYNLPAGYMEITGLKQAVALNTAWSVGCWVRFNAVTGTQTVVGAANQGSGTSAVHIASRSAGSIKVEKPSAALLVDSSVTPSTNTWYHVLYVYDGTNRIYVNGVQKATSATAEIAATPNAINIGRYHDSGFTGDTLNGKVIDVRYYNVPVPAAVVWQMWAPETRYDLWRPRSPIFVVRSAGTVTNKSIASTADSAVAVVRQTNKINAITAATAVALTRLTAHAIATTASSAVALVRQTGKLIASTAASSVVLVTAKTTVKAIAATAASAVVLVRQTQKVIATTASSAVALVRSTAHTVAVTASSAVALIRQTNKTIATTAASTVVLAAQKVFLRTIAATASSAVALVRQTNKTIALTQASAVSLTRQTSKVIAVTASSVVGAIKQTAKRIALAIGSLVGVTTAQPHAADIGHATGTIILLHGASGTVSCRDGMHGTVVLRDGASGTVVLRGGASGTVVLRDGVTGTITA